MQANFQIFSCTSSGSLSKKLVWGTDSCSRLFAKAYRRTKKDFDNSRQGLSPTSADAGSVAESDPVLNPDHVSKYCRGNFVCYNN